MVNFINFFTWCLPPFLLFLLLHVNLEQHVLFTHAFLPLDYHHVGGVGGVGGIDRHVPMFLTSHHRRQEHHDILLQEHQEGSIGAGNNNMLLSTNPSFDTSSPSSSVISISGRRNFLSYVSSSFSTVMIATTAFTIQSAHAATISSSNSRSSSNSSSSSSSTSIRITNYPPLEYLEPLYELKLSIDALREGITDIQKRPSILRRLEKMFSGGLFSEKNYLLGLAVMYNNQIVYDPNELSMYINLDKEERFNYIGSTLASLESIKNNLKGKNNVDETLLLQDMDSAQRSMNDWFRIVPYQNIEAVAQLYVATRMADVNRDGKLDALELATLLDQEREIWLKRVALVGD